MVSVELHVDKHFKPGVFVTFEEMLFKKKLAHAWSSLWHLQDLQDEVAKESEELQQLQAQRQKVQQALEELDQQKDSLEEQLTHIRQQTDQETQLVG